MQALLDDILPAKKAFEEYQRSNRDYEFQEITEKYEIFFK